MSDNPYLRTTVLTASPAQLQLMLLDGAIRFAQSAREGLATGRHEQAYSGVTRCQNVLMELLQGLRPENDPDLCSKLSGLYTFMYTRLMHAVTRKSAVMADEVLTLLRYERQTWQMLLDKLARENASAGRLEQTPDAPPPLDLALQPPSSSGDPTRLVGGVVSLQG